MKTQALTSQPCCKRKPVSGAFSLRGGSTGQAVQAVAVRAGDE